MTKEELTSAVAAKTGMTRRESAEFLDATLDTIMDAVIDGDRITLSGFGIFLLVERAPRKARNPRTGESIAVPGRKVPRFIPSQKFSDLAK